MDQDLTVVKIETETKTEYGGHEFDYESSTDLFRCTYCKQYEVSVRTDKQTITPCPGLAGYNGDTERVYLLVTMHPELSVDGWPGTFARRVFATGIGDTPKFSPRTQGAHQLMLVETAPSVVDQLEHEIHAMRPESFGSTAGMPNFAYAHQVERLTAEQGQAFLRENEAAFNAKYGKDKA